MNHVWSSWTNLSSTDYKIELFILNVPYVHPEIPKTCTLKSLFKLESVPAKEVGIQEEQRVDLVCV